MIITEANKSTVEVIPYDQSILLDHYYGNPRQNPMLDFVIKNLIAARKAKRGKKSDFYADDALLRIGSPEGSEVDIVRIVRLYPYPIGSFLPRALKSFDQFNDFIEGIYGNVTSSEPKNLDFNMTLAQIEAYRDTGIIRMGLIAATHELPVSNVYRKLHKFMTTCYLPTEPDRETLINRNLIESRRMIYRLLVGITPVPSERQAVEVAKYYGKHNLLDMPGKAIGIYMRDDGRLATSRKVTIFESYQPRVQQRGQLYIVRPS